MKRIIILFQLFVFAQANAQNEFAATAFYKEFRKIYSDGQTGFSQCRGVKRISGFEEVRLEYRSKCNLPLSDSGKIIYPVSGQSYAIFYFEPDKMRLKVDQRALNLREAIVVAHDQPLFARTETFLVKDHPFTKTLLFGKEDQEKSKDALFVMCIYNEGGKYFLSLEIRGKKVDED